METLKILTLRKYFANYVGSLTTIFAGPQLERYLGGGGGVYSYIHLLPDEFLLKSVVIRVEFKRNSRAEGEYMNTPPPPSINALVKALNVWHNGIYMSIRIVHLL